MLAKSVAGPGNRETSLERLQPTLFFDYWTCWKRNWSCCIGHTSCRTEHLRTKVYRADFFLLSIKLKPNPTLPNFSFAGAPGDYNYRLGNRLEEVTFHWFLFDISQTNYICSFEWFACWAIMNPFLVVLVIWGRKVLSVSSDEVNNILWFDFTCAKKKQCKTGCTFWMTV